MLIRQDAMVQKVLVIMTMLAALALGRSAVAQTVSDSIRNADSQKTAGSNTVLGADNQLLSVGSQAMLAGRWEDGIRLTLLGLERPGVTDHMRASALSNLCGGYAALEQVDMAIDYCTQSIELNDRNWRAWSNRSYAYWLMRDYELAGAELERATAINDRARQLFQIRGMLNEAGLVPRITMEDRQ